MNLGQTLRSSLRKVLGPENAKVLKRWAGEIKASSQSQHFGPVPSKDFTVPRKLFWEENGYLVLEGWVSHSDIDALNREVDEMWEHPAKRGKLVADIFLSTDQYRRVHFADAPDAARSCPFKLSDLYLVSPLVRNVILSPRLTALLSQILGRAPIVCNTLNFEFGSEQPFHTDSLYMTPPKDLNLCATWIALEDCLPEAGPLKYYPGSHKIPPYHFSNGRISSISTEMPAYNVYMEKQLAQRGLEPQTFCAKKGDLFIWHSQLFHGGMKILNPSLTRKSLVTHYFRAEDLSGPHGSLGPGRFFMRRDHQPIP
jgi:phytanoyl-CoA hydroxylase